LAETQESEDYHFELQVSDISDYSNILATYDSSLSQDGWFVQNEDKSYFAMPASGAQSRYYGLNVKFESQLADYLTRNEVYYFRVRQKTVSTTYSYRNTRDVIWS